MMVFIITCECGQKMQVEEKHFGLVGRCVRCRKKFSVTTDNTRQIPAEGEANVLAMIENILLEPVPPVLDGDERKKSQIKGLMDLGPGVLGLLREEIQKLGNDLDTRQYQVGIYDKVKNLRRVFKAVAMQKNPIYVKFLLELSQSHVPIIQDLAREQIEIAKPNTKTIAFDPEKFVLLLKQRGKELSLALEDVRLISDFVANRAKPDSEQVRQAKLAGKPIELWMWEKIGGAQPFVARAYSETEDFTEFAVEIALQGWAKYALHLYRACLLRA